jgi:hypothetical protein
MADEPNKDPSDELAALKARVEELERANKPPEPFKPVPYQRYDPTANFTLPPSVVREMAAAVPPNFMQDVVRDNRAPSGRAGAIPTSHQQPTSVRGNAPGDGTGWSEPRPLSNPPGTGPGSLADRIVDEFDRRDRAELVEREARLQAMEKLAERSK